MKGAFGVPFLVAGLALAGCRNGPPAPAEPKPTSDVIIRQVKKNLTNARHYRAKIQQVATLAMPGRPAKNAPRMVSVSEMHVSRPNQMYIATEVTSPGTKLPGMKMTLVFDGQMAWVHSGAGPDKKGVLHWLDQKKLGRDDAPFDLGMGLHGGGLAPGRDLVDTLRILFMRYGYEAEVREQVVDGEPCWILDGSEAPERAVRYMFQNQPDAVAGLIQSVKSSTTAGVEAVRVAAMLLRNQSRIRMWISKERGFPVAWTLGTKDGAMVEVRLAADRTPPHARAQFQIDERLRGAAVDRTQAVLTARKKRDEILANTVAKAKARRAVESALRQ